MAEWRYEWWDRVDRNGDAFIGTPSGTSTKIDLSLPPFNVSFGSFTGDSPPFRAINQNVPMTPGSYLKFIDTEENEVELTLFIKGKNEEDLYNIINGSKTEGKSLPNLFNPEKSDIYATAIDNPTRQRILTGSGRLRVYTPALEENPDNPEEKIPLRRDLICRCISGFKIRNSDLFVNYAYAPLRFYANQPYWRRSTNNLMDLGTRNQAGKPTPATWFTFNTTPTPDLDNITPGSGRALYRKKFNLINKGDVSTPPIWTVTGPGAAPFFILQNRIHPDRPFILSFSDECRIGQGENLVISIENRTAVITANPNDPNSTNRDVFRTIRVDSQFWEVPTNESTISVGVKNGGNAQYNVNNRTKIRIQYNERFTGVY